MSLKSCVAYILSVQSGRKSAHYFVSPCLSPHRKYDEFKLIATYFITKMHPLSTSACFLPRFEKAHAVV